MRCLEANLNGIDKTDASAGNKNYLMSRELDVDRNSIPPTFRGKTRAQLLEKIEKKAVEYGSC